MSHFTGPLLNEEKRRGSREWFSKLPIGKEPDYVEYFNDFLSAEDVDTTNAWTIVKDSSAAVAVVADATNGEVSLTSEATTDDDGSCLMSAQENWILTSGKRLWFECKAKLSDVDDMDAFIGMTDAIATNPENTLTDPDRVGFQVNDGDASVLCKTEDGGSETSTDSGVDLVDDTYKTFGFYWDGAASVEFYIDRAKVATHTTGITEDEKLCINLFELSGSDSGTKSMTVDYVYVCKER